MTVYESSHVILYVIRLACQYLLYRQFTAILHFRGALCLAEHGGIDSPLRLCYKCIKYRNKALRTDMRPEKAAAETRSNG